MPRLGCCLESRGGYQCPSVLGIQALTELYRECKYSAYLIRLQQLIREAPAEWQRAVEAQKGFLARIGKVRRAWYLARAGGWASRVGFLTHLCPVCSGLGQLYTSDWRGQQAGDDLLRLP